MGIRRATQDDLDAIHRVLERLGLPVEGVSDWLDHFLVLERDDVIVGTVGLEVYGRHALLRSLGVVKARRGRGWGDRLFQEVLARAQALEIEEIVLLTETATGFFQRRGFEEIAREKVPGEVRQSVEFRSACPASAVCMRRTLG